jgi:hypothetical protein
MASENVVMRSGLGLLVPVIVQGRIDLLIEVADSAKPWKGDSPTSTDTLHAENLEAAAKWPENLT